MPLAIPPIDNRKYAQILEDALARIPVHNPEWTNFNKSDPGVTLVEVFAFLTESLLYRANQIPERNRKKFLQLLGLGLQPASSARGLVSFSYSGGTPVAIALDEDVEVRAGQVPFRTEAGLDVLPIEAQAFYKKTVDSVDPTTQAYYDQLYASYREGKTPKGLSLYQTMLFSPRGTTAVNLDRETTDKSLWIALLMRPSDKPFGARLEAVREALLGKTLSLGIVPAIEDSGKRLPPGGRLSPMGGVRLDFQLPSLPSNGKLPENSEDRDASYRTVASTEVPQGPMVAQIELPGSIAELSLWTNLDPLESGTRDFPPALDGMEQNDRLITWIRILPSAPALTSLLWAGINTVFVRQRARIQNEVLPEGNGEPDQRATLARSPVLPGSVVLRVKPPTQATDVWKEIDDLGAAGPEVSVPDLREPPGRPQSTAPLVQVYTVDPEAGEIRFGDGLRGARPPRGAELRADYDYGVGGAGNVGPGQITAGTAVPTGIKVTNVLPTWGGANAESISEGERQIPRYLQHRDRLVSAADFETLALRTPGVAVGRVEILAAYHPALAPNQPGNAPGAVTVMAIPRSDTPPEAGGPDTFLDAIACWLDPRRLVTTEVFVRRPDYQPIWVSLGVDFVAGVSVATVRDAVTRAVERFLAPLPDPAGPVPGDLTTLAAGLQSSPTDRGWPLSKPVVALEIAAIANRVPGVLFVREVILAEFDGTEAHQIAMTGLQLPRLAGLSVATGSALAIRELRGTPSPQAQGQGPGQAPGQLRVPVPIIPEEC